MLDTAGAMRRFGLGPRPADLARIADVRAALRAELAEPTLAAQGLERLRSTTAVFAGLAQAPTITRMLEQQRQEVAQQILARAQANGERITPEIAARMATQQVQSADLVTEAALYRDEVAMRQEKALAAPVGFIERLAAFWANHFAIEATSSQIARALVGAFEREAIRPHVLGSFRAMLGAATRHPAMLQYLDNAQSIGPMSQQGRTSGRGLNENHARELLELHTVGVDAGYTQDDVLALAKILTGWTYQGRDPRAADLGQFLFRPEAHEPGIHVVMGVAYAQTDVAQGEAVLDFLAAHPATARFLAGKLARHFVPNPPAALIDRLAATYRSSGGNLGAMTRALIDADEAWTDASRLTSPQEFLWAALRALDVTLEPNQLIQALRALGHGPWEPPSPQGFPDDPAAWLAPDALTNRLDVAELLAARTTLDAPPVFLAQAILGSGLSANTLGAVTRAESRVQALALLLMSPEFQRR